MTRPARRLRWWLAGVLAVVAAAPLVGPTAPAAAAPQGQYAGTLSFEVTGLSPAVVGPTSSTVVVRGSMRNNGSEELTGVVARFQRGEAFTDAAQVQAEIDDPGQPESVLTGFTAVTDSIDPGETVDFALTTDAFSRPRTGLGITDPGVYPLMVNVNARFESGPDDGARVGELHSLLTVAGVPDGTAPVGAPQRVGMVMPLVDRPHRDPTGAFLDDDLAALISTGGRLEDVLTAAEDPELPDGSVTLAVDPELLQELTVMAAGYTVGPYVLDLDPAATASTAPTPTSTGTTGTGTAPGGTETTAPPGTSPAPTTGTTPSGTGSTTPTTQAPATTSTDASPTSSAVQPVPGPDVVPCTGTAAAQRFLDRLRALATTTPVLVLPYTDIDATAAVRAGHPEQVVAAVAQGRTVATAILGPQARLITDVGWPIDGLVDPATLSVLRGTGLDTVVLDRSGVTGDGAVGERATVGTSSGDVTAVLASSSVPDGPVDLNHFTALAAQRWLGGQTAGMLLAPARSWQPDRDEYAALSALLRSLERAGLVEGAGLTELTAGPAGAAATLEYPAEAVARELPAALFGRVQDLAAAMASTQRAFDPLTTDDRATIAPDDLFADVQAGLGRQAAGGYRADPGAAARANGAVRTIVDAVQSQVSITPPASAFTLTSSTSPLVVTIGNRLPYTVHVRISVDPTDALRAGITVTDVGVQTVPALSNVQVLLPAEVTRAGLLTLRVKLTTPDGAAWGPEQEIQLKSTAIGSFTVVLIIAAGAIVVLTTAIRIRKRYRQRRERIAAGLQ